MELRTKKRMIVKRCLVIDLLNDHFKSIDSTIRIPTTLKYVYIGAGPETNTIEIEWTEDVESIEETSEAKKDK